MAISAPSAVRRLFHLHARLSASMRPVLKMKPIHVFFCYTTRCNLNCEHCFYVGLDLDKLREPELTHNEWKGIINQLPWYTLVTITGGEPFIRPDALDTFSFLSTKHRFTIISNGTLISPAIADAIVTLAPAHIFRPGLVEISFSVQCNEKIHDRFTHQVGSYSKTVEGIGNVENAKRKAGKKYPLSSLRTIILPETVEYLSRSVRLADEHGLKRLILMVLDQSSRYLMFYGQKPADDVLKANKTTYIDKKILVESLSEVVRLGRDLGVQIVFSPAFITLDQVVSYYDNALDINKYKCSFCFSKLVVQATGDLFVCPLHCCGNIRNGAIMQLYHNPETNAFLGHIKQNGLFELCLGCNGMQYMGKSRSW